MDTESATYLIQTEIMSHISPGDTLLIPVVKVALTARMALILSRAWTYSKLSFFSLFPFYKYIYIQKIESPACSLLSKNSLLNQASHVLLTG